MNFFKRLKSATPKPYKLAFRIAAVAGSIATAILGAPVLGATLGVSLIIPSALKTILGWTVVASVFAGTTAKTVVTPEAMEDYKKGLEK